MVNEHEEAAFVFATGIGKLAICVPVGRPAEFRESRASPRRPRCLRKPEMEAMGKHDKQHVNDWPRRGGKWGGLEMGGRAWLVSCSLEPAGHKHAWDRACLYFFFSVSTQARNRLQTIPSALKPCRLTVVSVWLPARKSSAARAHQKTIGSALASMANGQWPN